MSIHHRPAKLNTLKRGLRILPKSGGYFVHVTSRVVQQRFLFGDEEKTVFTRMSERHKLESIYPD